MPGPRCVAPEVTVHKVFFVNSAPAHTSTEPNVYGAPDTVYHGGPT